MLTIKSIHVNNFKSFDSLDLELGNFNVIVGANASGKSNVIQAFKLLRDIAAHGLDNAISMQGGVEYLQNAIIGKTKELRFEVKLEEKMTMNLFTKDERPIVASTKEITYSFSLKFNKSRAGYVVSSDQVSLDCEYLELSMQEDGKNKRKRKINNKKIGEGKIKIVKDSDTLRFDVSGLDEYNLDIDYVTERMARLINSTGKGSRIMMKKSLLIELPYLFYPPLDFVFLSTLVFDFDPKLPRKGVPVSGKKILEEDGNNLALVLKGILDDKEKKRKFSNLVKDLLPFVDELDVEKFADKSMLFMLKETYTKENKFYLPASLLSEGTINITALIIALYFNETRITQMYGLQPLIIIEEPEKNIHPGLTSKIVKLMKESSEKRQIIVTTHSPQVVKNAGLNNIILISRNKDGFSVIQRPEKSVMVQEFIKNQIGVDDLFTSGLLGE